MRTPAGRFVKGLSGNPRGKPLGTRNRATLAAQALLDGEAEAITRKAIDLAKDGDISALRLCLERIIPPVRESLDVNVRRSELKFNLSAIGAEELDALEHALVRMIELANPNGERPPDEIETLVGALDGDEKDCD